MHKKTIYYFDELNGKKYYAMHKVYNEVEYYDLAKYSKLSKLSNLTLSNLSNFNFDQAKTDTIEELVSYVKYNPPFNNLQGNPYEMLLDNTLYKVEDDGVSRYVTKYCLKSNKITKLTYFKFLDLVYYYTNNYEVSNLQVDTLNLTSSIMTNKVRLLNDIRFLYQANRRNNAFIRRGIYNPILRSISSSSTHSTT